MQAAEVILIALLAPIAFSAAYWFTVLHRVLRAQRLVPDVLTAIGQTNVPRSSNGAPLVSIIVPAHNEAEEIEDCTRTLLEQGYPNLEVIAVLDRCTDQTAERLRSLADDQRLRVIHNDACPPDWAGKCNAAWIGARQARGQWLLFTDADTRFDRRLVHAALAMAQARELDLLSLISTLSTSRWFERVVQPVASMNLMRLYPIDRVNRPGSKRNFANGQFMLISRTMYEKCGGHSAVKQALLEDIALARALRKAGGRGETFFDGGMLRCSMYTSYPAFREGWKRIYIDACRRRPWRMRKSALRLLLMGVADPLVRALAIVLAIISLAAESDFPIIAEVTIAGAVLASIAKHGALAATYRAARAAWVGIPLFMWGAVEVARILLHAANTLSRRIPIRWGGREYVFEPQGPWN